MAPENDLNQTETDDLLMLTRHFEAMKLMERGSLGSSEPAPDGMVSSSNLFNGIKKAAFNIPYNGGSDLFRDDKQQQAPSPKRQYNNNNNNNNKNNNNKSGEAEEQKTGENLFHRMRGLLKHPSLDVSTMINKEMLKIDARTRNAIFEEVHGVGSLCPDESQPGLVENALRDLMIELQAIPANQKIAYTQSLSMPHSYVHTTAFRMRFLRAELFRAKLAAYRLTMFLNTLLELFGPYALERPIRLSDFSKKELKAFNSGRIQLLPFRDRGGRRVVVGIPSHDHTYHQPETRAKIHLYLWWVASASVETQRKGLIMVTIHSPFIKDNHTTSAKDTKSSSSDNHGVDSAQDVRGLPSLRFAQIYVNARRGMPCRLICLHSCTPDTPYYAVVRAFNSAMTENKARLKFHIGEDVENRYKLSGFGIPLDQLPVTESGKIKTQHFKKWLALRKYVEDASIDIEQYPGSVIECPNMNDVVFRPSQSTLCHPGNVMFRSLVESKHLEHSVAPSREAKVELTRSVMNQVKEKGGRFLVWNNDTFWTEMTDEKLVYAKIAVFFRNSKASAKAKSNRQNTTSSTYMFADQDKRRKLDICSGVEFCKGGDSRNGDSYKLSDKWI